ncbi:MAG: DinB family protein [bacterium]
MARVVFYNQLFHPLDFYLSAEGEELVPPSPFSLTKLDPEGLLPERIYSKNELRNYLAYCREKLFRILDEITGKDLSCRFIYGSIDLPYFELTQYNMRHMQHHTGQLNLYLRQRTDSAPHWVKQAKKHKAELFLCHYPPIISSVLKINSTDFF